MTVAAVIVLPEYNYWPALPKKIYTNPFQPHAIEPRCLTNYWPSLRPFIANLRISTQKLQKNTQHLCGCFSTPYNFY